MGPGLACVAEREGFEPSIQLWTVYWFSKPAPSASRPPLQIVSRGEGRPGKRSVLDRREGAVKDVRAAVLALCTAACAHAPGPWVQVRSAYFEVRTQRP